MHIPELLINNTVIIATVCIAIFVILVYSVGKQRKNLWLEKEYEFQDLKVLNMLRLLMTLSALLAIPLGLFRSAASYSIFDPTWLRALATFLILAPVFASFKFAWFRDNIRDVSIFFYIFLTFFLFILLFANNFTIGYFIDVLIIVSALPIIFSSFRGSILYLSFYSFLALITYCGLENPSIDSLTCFSSVAITSFVSLILLKAKTSIEAQLSIANQVLGRSNTLVLLSNKEGQYVYANEEIQTFLGIDENSILKESWTKNHYFDDVSNTNIEQYLIQLTINKANSESKKVIQKYEISPSNYKWVLWKDTILDDGTILRVGIDHTSHHEAEVELKESEAIFREIAESVNETSFLYNIEEQKYEYINPNCVQVLGVDETFFYEGKSYTNEFVFKEDIAELEKANNIIISGGAYDINYRIIVNGEIKWINEHSVPIHDEEGRLVKNSGTCRDITLQKMLLKTIDDQNEETISSINYALKIQESALPTQHEINKVFPDNFVFYKPRDIVSGDFYVIDTIRENNGTVLPMFYIGDCTGHGVPGSILSILCISLIKESFTKYDVNSPAEAMDFVRKKIISFFRSNLDNFLHDGMDGSYGVINNKTDQMYYSGANSSCIIVREGKLIEHKGDAQHVGYSFYKQEPFNLLIIDLKKGDHIYFYTDGFVDQFGGPKDKKFTKRRLHDLFIEFNKETIEKQKIILEKTFYDWKGLEDQTDDVTVFGFKYK